MAGPVGAAVGRREVGERGSGAVLATAVCATLLTCVVAALAVVAVVLAGHRARAAADLAALAAMGATTDGRDPCAAAQVTAGRNGARLVDCRPAGTVVRVRVVVTAAGRWGVARAEAVAGQSAEVEP